MGGDAVAGRIALRERRRGTDSTCGTGQQGDREDGTEVAGGP